MSEQEILELDYLKYFYQNVGDFLGPADDEIFSMLRNNYKGRLPDHYANEEK